MSPWWNPFTAPQASAESSYQRGAVVFGPGFPRELTAEEAAEVAPARLTYVVLDDEGDPVEFGLDEVLRAQEVLNSIELFDWMDSVRSKSKRNHDAAVSEWSRRLISV